MRNYENLIEDLCKVTGFFTICGIIGGLLLIPLFGFIKIIGERLFGLLFIAGFIAVFIWINYPRAKAQESASKKLQRTEESIKKMENKEDADGKQR